MGWLIFVLTIVYLAYRALSSASKPRPIQTWTSYATPVKSVPPDHFEDKVNDLINDMRCCRCNTGEVPTYKKEHGNETLKGCCETFLKEIAARIEAHFSTDRVTCTMTYLAKETDSAASPVKKRGALKPVYKISGAEPEILITYLDSKGQETTRKLSNLRYSKTSYYFKAYCHLREAERHFNPDGIKQAIDLMTGEVLDTLTVKWGDKGKTRKFTGIGWE